MINILVTITVSEQNRPQTLRLLEQLTEASQQENGNISYQHYLHPTDPEQLLIVELWQNGEVLAAHEATRHFTTLLPQIEKLSDGIDIRKIKISSLRRHFGQMLQDVFLFSDTIEENIKMGQRKELQMEAVRLAAEDAKARGFIEKMDEQYETVIGERGVGLSGGQKQRISIARALAKHSPILVLDDSTSALDMETEHEIQQTLNALRDTTKIIIAHRISAVRHADEIIYLADGKIAERGTHEELLAKKGLYYDTYMAQYGALAMSSASAGEPAPAACC